MELVPGDSPPELRARCIPARAMGAGGRVPRSGRRRCALARRVDAAVGDAASRYPVLVLSPSGFPPLLFGSLAEELASQGFVVVGVNHTYETTVTVFGDGRIVPMNPAAIGGALGPQAGSHEAAFGARAAVCEGKADDLAFVADQIARLDTDSTSRFAGRLDTNRVGGIGHSFGGNAAVEWCRTDPRCCAAVNLDGAIWTEVGKVGPERPALQGWPNTTGSPCHPTRR